MNAKGIKPSQLKPPTKIAALARPNPTTIPKFNIESKPKPHTTELLKPQTKALLAQSTVKTQARPLLRRRSKSVADLRPLRTLDHNLKSTTNQTTVKPPVKRPGHPQPAPDLELKKAKVVVNKKPAPYDYKARFNLLQEKHSSLKQSYNATTSDLLKLKADSEVYSDRITNLTSELDLVKKENTRLVDDNDTLKTQVASSISQVHNLENVNKKLESTIDAQEKELHKLKTTYDHIKTEYDALVIANDKIEEQYKQATSTINTLSESLLHYKTELRHVEDLRRQLHNTILDLKGNIRVFCRVRKSLPSEHDKTICSMEFVDDNRLEIRKCKESISNISGRSNELKQSFAFDKVFYPESSQYEVFEELAQLIQSALDGYDICVFAYGQTGSGKTYTMQGEPSESCLGIIPRSVDLIFEKIDHLKKSGWSYTIHASFLEIYNETLRDLLDPYSNKALEIKYNEGKGITVSNLRTERTNTREQLKSLMSRALRNRSVAATDFNEHSSRSHAVTKITLFGTHIDNASIVYSGSLNLVDLAGSECIKTSSGERMMETKNINKSLSALGSVMLSLFNKESHIPYRDSKLTYLLQSSLGGTSKTLMFVNISPLEECYNESLNSLRFATKVKEVKTVSKRNKTLKSKSIVY